MAKYRHYRTGRVVTVADDDPKVKEMDAGKRWERVVEDAKPAVKQAQSVSRPVRDNPQA